MTLLRRLFERLLPPVSRRDALRVACRPTAPLPSQCTIYGRPPSSLNLYGTFTEPCWYVYVPWGDGLDGSMLRSSRIVLISKATGRVLYDGSANDEG